LPDITTGNQENFATREGTKKIWNAGLFASFDVQEYGRL
jgi:hypothetical protein